MAWRKWRGTSSMLRWCIKTFLSVVLTISLFGQANPGGGVNIPAGSGGISQLTGPVTAGPGSGSQGTAFNIADCSVGGTFVKGIDPNGTLDCSTPAGGGATRGVFASAPTCNAGAASTAYFATDAGLFGQCNGTSWFWMKGSVNAVPTVAANTNTWFNQGTASITNTTSGAATVLLGVGDASNAIRGRVRAVPATPYTYIVCFTGAVKTANFANIGLMLTDGTDASTSKLATFYVFNQSTATSIFQWSKWTNATSFSADYAIGTYGANSAGAPYVCMALQDNGTTRKIAYSYDKQDWNTLNYAGVSNTDFLTPTNIGYFANANNSGEPPRLLIWSEEVVAAALF